MSLEEVVHAVACGLDVHSAEIVACLARSGPKERGRYEERRFATNLRGLTELREWLIEARCEAVGMEATGVYWMPVYAALEGHVPMVVGNPQHMKGLRGQKTDRKDARWIVNLVRHGLIRPSFVPKPEFRDARELTRFRRQLIHERTRVRNEVQRLLARQGITLGKELSNVFGASGMAILESLVESRNVLMELPRLVHRGVKKGLDVISAALEAPLPETARWLLEVELERLETLEVRIKTVEDRIAAVLKPYESQIMRLLTVPGIQRISACIILAEIGVDMSAWPTEKHLSAWAGVAPGCRESGGKQKGAGTRKGNPYLCSTLMECAGAAVKKKGCHLGGKYHRLCFQTGSKMKARMAIARKLLLIVYRLLTDNSTYLEPQPQPQSPQARKRIIQKRISALEDLGFHVSLTPLSMTR
jgi:transposase